MEDLRNLAIWYLQNCRRGEDRVSLFKDFVDRRGQRIGQAFCNLIPTGELSRLILAGLDVDPFYVDENIPAAVDLLTTKE